MQLRVWGGTVSPLMGSGQSPGEDAGASPSEAPQFSHVTCILFGLKINIIAIAKTKRFHVS